MKKVLEAKKCKINYSKSLEPLARETVSILDKKILEYQNFFQTDFNEQFVVNYFDDIEEFRDFIKQIRGGKEPLPEYAVATYDNDMVNSYIETNIQLKRKYRASHELFHILYKKYILKNDYSKRIIWYDEGMAQFLSGEKDNLKDETEFINFYQKVREETKKIPEMNSLQHGKAFYNENYNGYNLSYLAVRYLSETMNESEFKELMNDFSKIKNIGEIIIQDMFDYYNTKLKTEINKKRK